MYNPVRGGNRGGRDQFTWEEIRLLPFKERECYLGSTVKMGYLDKGGRWRMRDWWTKGDKYGPADKKQMSDELRRVQEEDERRMREALGLETKQVDNTPHLSQYEINELTKRDRMDIPPPEEGERLAGLGFNPANAKFKDVNMDTVYDKTDYNKLDGEGIRGDDLKRMQKADRKEAKDQVRKALRDDIPTAEGVLESSKKIKKEKKKREKKDKDRKEKKEKKHKKKEKRDKEKSERDHHEKEKEKPREDREREREREREKDKPREDREKDREREGRDRDREKHRDHRDHRDKHRDRSRERRRSEEKDRHRERRRSEDREKERERRKKSRRDRSRSSSSSSSGSRSD